MYCYLVQIPFGFATVPGHEFGGFEIRRHALGDDLHDKRTYSAAESEAGSGSLPTFAAHACESRVIRIQLTAARVDSSPGDSTVRVT